jgi:hypothetical protein
MRGRFMVSAVAALALIAGPSAPAHSGDRPAAVKSIKVKKKRAGTDTSRPQPTPNAGEMTPGTGPPLLRGVKDDNM